jgi:ribosome-binding protein aMBF1 (putative translation factor)
MKLSDLQNKLQNDSEFVMASKKLELGIEFANSILEARIDQGLSQAELAELVGTKQANISRIEAGIANPTFGLMERMTKALGIEICFINLKNQPEKKENTAVSHISGDYFLVKNWPQYNQEKRIEMKISDASDNSWRF